MTAPAGTPKIGRAPATTQAELAHIGISLFVERGFDRTTIDDIAAAAGIGRRTFFRYFPSKNDLPWGDFEALVERMRQRLASFGAEVPTVDALELATLEFNTFPPNEVGYHRRRMELLLNVPSLVAHSTLRYAEWRQVVAEFVAARLGVPEDGLRPQVVAWTLLAVSLAAYEQWLKREDADLLELIRASYAELHDVLAGDWPS